MRAGESLVFISAPPSAQHHFLRLSLYIPSSTRLFWIHLFRRSETANGWREGRELVRRTPPFTITLVSTLFLRSQSFVSSLRTSKIGRGRRYVYGGLGIAAFSTPSSLLSLLSLGRGLDCGSARGIKGMALNERKYLLYDFVVCVCIAVALLA